MQPERRYSIARQHGVNANQVFHWRKLYREGRLGEEPAAGQLVPVRISEVLSGEQAPAYEVLRGVLWWNSAEPASASKELWTPMVFADPGARADGFRCRAAPTSGSPAGVTDSRRGFTGLERGGATCSWEKEPYSGHACLAGGAAIWSSCCVWDGDGLPFAKRLERGRFIWPQAEEGSVSLSRAQLSMLLEGID